METRICQKCGASNNSADSTNDLECYECKKTIKKPCSDNFNSLDSIVKEMLEQHKGGEKFFNHLDLAVQSQPIVEELLELVQEKNIIVSGKFGVFFSNYLKEKNMDINLILVSGGLRTGTYLEDLGYMQKDIKNKEFVFVDDSFYSGKTRDVVNQEIEKQGGALKTTYVIYDGSRNRDMSVKSLYRYYDNVN